MAYTYILKCNVTEEFYYGCRYAKNSTPDDFWVSYFTSSKYVKELLIKYGKESFSYQIRKISDNNGIIQNWEHKVLRRLKVIDRADFLNRTDNKSISSEDSAKGAKNRLPLSTEDREKLGERMRKLNSGRKRTEEWKIAHSKLMMERQKDGGFKLGKKEDINTRKKKSNSKLGKSSGMLGKSFPLCSCVICHKELSGQHALTSHYKIHK